RRSVSSNLSVGGEAPAGSGSPARSGDDEAPEGHSASGSPVRVVRGRRVAACGVGRRSRRARPPPDPGAARPDPVERHHERSRREPYTACAGWRGPDPGASRGAGALLWPASGAFDD
ncbi:unnamed protein product, partial [Urochloa humidicola]